MNYSVSIKFSVENPDFHPTNEEIEKAISTLLEDGLGVCVESVLVAMG